MPLALVQLTGQVAQAWTGKLQKGFPVQLTGQEKRWMEFAIIAILLLFRNNTATF